MGIKEVIKHLPGKHSQASHAGSRGRGGSGGSSGGGGEKLPDWLANLPTSGDKPSSGKGATLTKPSADVVSALKSPKTKADLKKAVGQLKGKYDPDNEEAATKAVGGALRSAGYKYESSSRSSGNLTENYTRGRTMVATTYDARGSYSSRLVE